MYRLPSPRAPKAPVMGWQQDLLGAWGSWELPVVSGAVIWGPVSPMQGVQAGARTWGSSFREFLLLPFMLLVLKAKLPICAR